jgi:hypothetical protein
MTARNKRHRAAAARLLQPAVLVAALSASGQALAGRPFATEDAGVLDRGRCEIEVVGARERGRDQEPERATSARLGCGVGAATQLGFGGARYRVSPERWTTLAVDGKTSLRPGGPGDVAVALAYAIGAEKRPGGGYEHALTSLDLVASETRGSVTFHGNLGARRHELAGSTAFAWAFAIEQSGDRFDAGIEAFGENSRSAWYGAGLRYAITPGRFLIDASYVVRGNSSREQRTTVGLKVLF